MTTAQAIEAMTDAGKFETLAIRVLRLIDSDCASIEHLGVNAKGQTVKHPIDAFTIVPNTSPPRYVMAQFATTDPETLEGKWLFDHRIPPTRARKPGVRAPTPADDGDLLKAARSAENIRKTDPNASFVVWLCSNRLIDEHIRTKTNAEGTKLGLTVKFLGQSTIRDTLDAPSGQWIRKQNLGIAARAISLPLLRAIS